MIDSQGRRKFFKKTIEKVGERASNYLLKKLHVFQTASEEDSEHVVLHSHESKSATFKDGTLENSAFIIQHAGKVEFYDRLFFRPPGALSEEEFLEACQCSQVCIQVCPEQCIVPAQEHMGAPVGTPILFPNESACTLCGKCLEDCPSGALLPIPQEFIRIGLAHIHESVCLGYQEESCTFCYDACPTTPKSIAFLQETAAAEGSQKQLLPVVQEENCTGCGLCVQPCPTLPKAIEIRLRPFPGEQDSAQNI